MKNIPSRISRRTTLLVLAASCVALFGGAFSAKADDIFSTDFSKGSFDTLGWVADGSWSIKDFGAGNPTLENNPGPVAVFAANGTTEGTLTKKFDTLDHPSSLSLTFDAGYGWGAKDHSQSLQVLLLDSDGNGYDFRIARAKATWGAQWGLVTKYVPDTKTNWAGTEIDATQKAIHDGGGLRTFTVTRDANGNWSFSGVGLTGGPLLFGDATTKTFSQVVLRGDPNNDELAYGKIKLEATK